MKKFHRQSIRLHSYDYALQGLYYVTICTKNRELYFENYDIRNFIQGCWIEIPKRFENVELDCWIVMPNHIHGIIIIGGRGDPCGRPQQYEGNHKGYPYNGRPRLGDIIGAFKSETTHYYTKNVKTKNWPEFEGKLWQRNYYEHIIRNQKSLDEIRKYIKLNPYMWDRDRNNPKNFKNKNKI